MKNKKLKRYILLLKEDTPQRMMNIMQKELDIKLVSSAELSSKVKAKDIFSSGRGVFLKNLGISVIEGIEEEKLIHVAQMDSSVLHWELEREFFPVAENEYLNPIKSTLALLNQQVNHLENILREKIKEDPEDTVKNYLFNLRNLGLEKSKYSGKGINVAILDTGFYKAHPDFANRQIDGKSFVAGEEWDLDGHGHGTHCTGTAAGYISLENDNRYGVAYESNIFIAKVLSDTGSGVTSNILDGIDWALEKQCQVISMSLGSTVEIGEKPSPIFEQVGRKALEKKALIIAAAGNDSKRPNELPRPVSSPANAESIMAVAALDENLNVAYFSNGGLNAADGGRIDISAPGVNILSSYSENASNSRLYKMMNGTSMATPHVAGVAALYFEAYPNLSAAEIWLKMEKSAKELQDQLLRDVGAGIIQVV